MNLGTICKPVTVYSYFSSSSISALQIGNSLPKFSSLSEDTKEPFRIHPNSQKNISNSGLYYPCHYIVLKKREFTAYLCSKQK